MNLQWLPLFALHSHRLGSYAITRLHDLFNLLKDMLKDYDVASSVKYLEKRYDDLKKYSRYLLAKDVYVLRLNIEFTCESKFLGKTEQATILTELLRRGRSAKSLAGFKGYFLRWDQKDQQKKTYADLILFFDHQSRFEDQDLLQIWSRYFIEFLENYNEKEKEKDVSYESRNFSILSRSIFLSQSKLRFDPLKIETLDKGLKKSFMTFFVPYYCHLDLFLPWEKMDNEPKIKRFTMGQLPKKKKTKTTKPTTTVDKSET